MKPTVSVVLLTYKQAAFLRAAVDSVLAQQGCDFELIAVNDCSPDNSRELLSAYEGRPNVRIVHNETNKGLQRSADEAIRSARGEYILWTSGDDVHLPGLLAAECGVLDRNPRVGFVYCRSHLLAPDGAITGTASSDKPWLEHDYVRAGLEEFEALLHGNHVATTGAVLFRRSLYEQVGGLDFDLPEGSDWDLWLRLCLVSDAAHIAAPLFGWRRHGGTLSVEMMRSGQYYADTLAILRKALALAPKAASHLVELEGKLLGDIHMKVAAQRYLAGTGATTSLERRAHAREARQHLSLALRENPHLLLSPSKIKLGICILLGPTWGPRAVRLKRGATATDLSVV